MASIESIESISEDPDISFSHMQADQACKECRRRKAKCNRTIPTCNLCVRYRRHCLYEKHSRTPLTRKHLTEVEERLERAEALVRQMRAILPPQLQAGRRSSAQSHVAVTTSPQTEGHPSPDDFNFASLGSQAMRPMIAASNANPWMHRSSAAGHQGETMPTDAGGQLDEQNFNKTLQSTETAASRAMGIERHDSSLVTAPVTGGMQPRPQERDVGRSQHNPLESPPITDDFEWDEQETTVSYSPSPNDTDETEGGTPVLDGMASLSVDENEAGYLGVASGAALLRLLEPEKRRRRSSAHTHRPSTRFTSHPPRYSAFLAQPDPNRHIVDSMIDAYFGQYHLSYPIIHEPTFRAQYSEVIPRPNGDSWMVLAYVVAAIGVFTSATTHESNLDLALFAQAKAILNFNFLEMGNLTLVQALTLASNYQQKRDKPNAGYNYLGLAVRMAMGLGLHKEFQGWTISPLNMEIRRRVWWSLCVFDVGATITFSRPQVWPYDGVEVSLPMNVHDRELTAASKTYPAESDSITPYTAVRTQASFHLATLPIYARVISKPFPAASELLALERAHFEPWLDRTPRFFREGAGADPSRLPPRYALSHAVMAWRSRNFRIIMYRPFVIRRALRDRSAGMAVVTAVSTRPSSSSCASGASSAAPAPAPAQGAASDSAPGSAGPPLTGGGGGSSTTSPDHAAEGVAYSRCLADADATIASVGGYWAARRPGEHTRLEGWYALYFLFQASLIPCICLRNCPSSPQAPGWRAQIAATLRTIAALAEVNPSAGRSHQIIADLCGRYLDAGDVSVLGLATAGVAGGTGSGVGAAPFADGQLRHQQQQQQQQQGGFFNAGDYRQGDAIGMSDHLGRSGMTPEGMGGGVLGPVGESPQTQINSVYSMMWPNAQPLEAADLVMGDDAWMEFLGR